MEPSVRRSVVNLLTSVAPYLGLTVAGYFLLRVSILFPLLLAIPAAGFLVRTFIVFHDCAHASFLPSKRANAVLGGVLGVIVYQPFQCWRHEHAVHHATAGDLDRRGVGDVKTLTVDEYLAEPWWGRLGYRLFRNPFVMFVLGPLWVVFAGPRLVPRGSTSRIRRSVLGTDLAIAAVIAAGCLLVGWQDFLLVAGPALWITGSVGIWLFYVQHQFEDAYWQHNDEWNYDEAALEGSSYLKLPTLLRWFSGNIGLHHVHHLSARIPNYNLLAAHTETAGLQSAPTLELGEALGTYRLKLWDERERRLVTFKQARAAAAGVPTRRAATGNSSA
jgi:omega-6 fatty acid desaturase (delta-12 desaturase)